MVMALTTLAIGGCSLPGLGPSVSREGIVIASGNTTERQIMAEVVGQMIQHYMPDQRISTVNNLGSSILIHQAFMYGNVNVSAVMYTGTSITGELGFESETDPEVAMRKVQQGYVELFDSKWYDSYGFENTYAFMITEETAQKYNIRTVSDLEPHADQFDAGVDTSWLDREGDGYNDFLRVYGFDFKNVMPMEIGLVYNALSVGEMDVVLGYTTDGRVDSYNLVVLEDDRQLFPAYDACPVVTHQALEEHPELDGVINRLIGQIDTSMMQALNRSSDEDLIEPHLVAQQFLEEHNYFAGGEDPS
ncbi:MAG TPA: osmoprotectant ABC transporter substrate-binding protein [Clostridiaceae bacterium]|nr:osmoprotectant ABC transporter substrate-binding protein [Clostridiaceae bacterium]